MTVPCDQRIAEQIAASVRGGDHEEVRHLFTAHPECRTFLDLPETITGAEARWWPEYAELHGQREIASMLRSEFWDPIRRGLYDIIASGDIESLQRIVEEHPRYVRGFPDQMVDMLATAAHNSQIKVVQMLLGMGADINATELGGRTALDNAVAFASPETVEYLLNQGADPNVGSRPVLSAINRAPEELALRLVQLLVEHGADVNREYTVFGDKNHTFTALAWAGSKSKIADYLRSKGSVEPKKRQQKASPKTLAEEIVAYFEEEFGPVEPKAQIEIVPSGLPIAIHLIPGGDDRKCVTLFTTGMSEEPMTAPEGTDDFRFAELFIQLPADWPTDEKSLSRIKNRWPFHWLRSVAQYPHQHKTWLGGPVTIIANGAPPEPLAPGLGFTSLLAMADRKFVSRDGRTIYLYRVTPLYSEERQLELDRGIAALLRAFDERDVPQVVDVSRPNVALAAK